MRVSTGAGLIAVAASFVAGGPATGDQGKSGDGTDWGCGGHPATAATLSTGTANGHKGAFFSTQAAWQNWWYLNRPTLLAELSYRVTPDDPTLPDKWRDEVRGELIKQLESSVVPLASGAALALGRVGDPRDSDTLARIAANSRRQQNLRRRAVLALGLVPKGPEDAALRARTALGAVAQEAVGNYDDRLELWSFAVYGLGLRGDLAALPQVDEFVRRYRGRKDSDDHGVHREVMAAAVSTLGLLRDPLVLPQLLETLDDDSGSGSMQTRNEMLASFAASGLARLGDRTALPRLCRAAGSERPVQIRRGAVLALGALAGPADAEAVKVLVTLVSTERDDPARGFAAIALGRTGADAAPGALQAAYKSGSSIVRSYASLGLGLYARRTHDASVQSFLLQELLKDHDPYELGALCIANGLAVNMPAQRRLELIALTGGETSMRSHAAFALGLLGIEGVRPQALLELIRTGDGVIRHEAALALGLARTQDGVPALLGIVQGNGSSIDRGSAMVGLGRIAGPGVAPALLKVLRDDHEVNAMRICAAHGLGLLFDKSEGRKLGAIGADVNWINESNRILMMTEVLDQLLLIMD